MSSGSGSLANFNGLGLPVTSTTKVFLSHLHADHVGDMPTLLWSLAKAGRRDPVEVWGPAGEHEHLGTRAYSSAAPASSEGFSAAPMSATGPRRPLVVIRFDRANVQYEQPLYNAVSRALQRRPNAMFDLVAVAPTQGNAARVALATNSSKKNAESVLRSLSDMGLPLDRVRLSALTSNTASTSEVHLYVR